MKGADWVMTMVVHRAGVEMRAIKDWRGIKDSQGCKDSQTWEILRSLLPEPATSPAIDQMCGFGQLAQPLWPSAEWEDELDRGQVGSEQA